MRDRPLPTKVGFLTKGYIFHPFPFWDRIKVLFGYRLVMQNNIASQHNPGKLQIHSRVILTAQVEGPKAIAEIEAEDMRLQEERRKELEARGVDTSGAIPKQTAPEANE